ncbi:MAG: hypothetical protein AB1726_09125, partial [Planctomycetota bacterium]
MSPLVRRVATGGSLAGGVVLLLLAAEHVLPAALLSWTVALFLAGAGTWELARLGSLAPLRLAWPAGAATVLCAGITLFLALGLLPLPLWLTPAR